MLAGSPHQVKTSQKGGTKTITASGVHALGTCLLMPLGDGPLRVTLRLKAHQNGAAQAQTTSRLGSAAPCGHKLATEKQRGPLAQWLSAQFWQFWECLCGARGSLGPGTLRWTGASGVSGEMSPAAMAASTSCRRFTAAAAAAAIYLGGTHWVPICFCVFVSPVLFWVFAWIFCLGTGRCDLPWFWLGLTRFAPALSTSPASF